MRGFENAGLASIISARPLPAATYDFVTGRYAVAGLGVLPSFAAACAFSRASPAVRVNPSRLYEQVAVDAPRWECDRTTGALLGLLWEDEATDLTGGTLTLGNVTLVPNAALGPDGLMSATRIVPTTGTNSKNFGRSDISFGTGQTYTLAGSFKAGDFRYLRKSYPSNAFADDWRVATSDVLNGVLGSVQSSTRATIRAAPAGAPGWFDDAFFTSANGSGAGFAGWVINPTGTTTSGNVTGDGVKSLLVWRPRLLAGPRPGSPTPSTGYRAPDVLSLRQIPAGAYEVMIYGQGRSGRIPEILVDDKAAGLYLPSRLPEDITIIQRIEVFQRNKISRSVRIARLPEVSPAPRFQFVAGVGETHGAGSDISAWSGGAAATATQPTAANRPISTAIGGVALVRSTATAQTNMVATGCEPSDPERFTLAWNFRPALDAKMIAFGANNAAGAVAFGLDALIRALVTTPNVAVLRGPSLLDDTGGMTRFVYAKDGARHSFFVNGAQVAPTTDTGVVTLAATARTLFCNTPGDLHFDGWTRELTGWDGCLTQAQIIAQDARMAADTATVVVPSANLLSAGAAFSDRFTVSFDASGSFPTWVDVAAVSDAGFANVLATTQGTPITPQAKSLPQGRFCYPIKHTPTGLPPDTAFRYCPVVNGVRDVTRFGIARTAPAVGTPWAGRFAYLSCSSPSNASQVMATHEKVVAEGFAIAFQQGDNGYTDRTDPTIEGARDAMRLGRRNVSMSALFGAGINVETMDDHDLTPNDWQLGDVVSGASGAVMAQTSIQAYTEIVPHYPLWDPQARCLAFHLDWGNHRIVCLDTRYQSRQTGGPVSVLGKDPGCFPQLQAFIDNLAAMPAHIRTFEVISPRGWPEIADYQWFDRDELAALCGAIRANPRPCFGMTGDAHYTAFEDGRNFPINGIRMPWFISSPAFHNPASGTAQVYSWKGTADTRVTNFARQFMNRDKALDGSFTMRRYVRTTASVTPLFKDSVSTADDSCTISVAPAARTVPPGRTVAVEKTWFGPYGFPIGQPACTVDYAVTGGQSGTLAWGPNEQIRRMPVPLAEGSYPLTFSNPVRCTAPAPGITITVADDAAMTAYLAAGPSGSVTAWRSIYRDLYYGLKDAGVLAKLDRLLFYAAGDAVTARMSLVGGVQQTAVGGMTHAAGLGYTSDGATGYLDDPTYNPGAGGTLLAQNSASFWYGQATSNGSTANGIGNSQHQIQGLNGAGGLTVRAATSGLDFAVPPPVGRTLVSRTGATTTTVYRDNAVVGTHGRAASALTSEPWRVFGRVGSTAVLGERLTDAGAGAGLMAADVATLNQLLSDARTAAAALA